MTRDISSVLEDDPYEEIESLEAQTDEDASTVSVEGSALGDYSNADTLSDFAYDSEMRDESEDESQMDFVSGSMSASAVAVPEIDAPTPMGLSRLENEQLASDGLFTSTHTEATEKWQVEGTLSSSHQQLSSPPDGSRTWRHKFHELLLKLKAIPRLQPVVAAFDNIYNPGSVVGYVAAIVVAGLVAAAMRSVVYNVLTTGLQTPKVAPPMPVPTSIADYIDQPQHHYAVKSWAKLETLQQTREMLSRLTGGQGKEEVKEQVQAAVSEKASTIQRPFIAKDALASLSPSTKALSMRRKLLSKTKKLGKDERYYVAMRSGQVVKAETSSGRQPHKDLLGPLRRIDASKEQFKTTYDKDEGRIKVARAGKPIDRAPAQIVVRSGDKVIQRGSLNSANVLHWSPPAIPASDRTGEVSVVFVLPTEALVQEQVLDLGNAAAQDSKSAQIMNLPQRIGEYMAQLEVMLESLSQRLRKQNISNRVMTRLGRVQEQSARVVKRAQAHAAQVDRAVQLYMKEVDERMSALWNEHASRLSKTLRKETMMRTRRAQSRSRRLRWVLEHHLQQIYATAHGRFRASSVEGPLKDIATRWRKLLMRLA